MTHRDEQWAPAREVGEGGDGDGARRVRHGEHGVTATQDLGDRRLVAQARREVQQGHSSRLSAFTNRPGGPMMKA